jgi:hypothetical protein
MVQPEGFTPNPAQFRVEINSYLTTDVAGTRLGALACASARLSPRHMRCTPLTHTEDPHLHQVFTQAFRVYVPCLNRTKATAET